MTCSGVCWRLERLFSGYGHRAGVVCGTTHVLVQVIAPISWCLHDLSSSTGDHIVSGSACFDSFWEENLFYQLTNRFPVLTHQ